MRFVFVDEQRRTRAHRPRTFVTERATHVGDGEGVDGGARLGGQNSEVERVHVLFNGGQVRGLPNVRQVLERRHRGKPPRALVEHVRRVLAV